nr:hypothetical protein [Bacteroidales bacterium]
MKRKHLITLLVLCFVFKTSTSQSKFNIGIGSILYIDLSFDNSKTFFLTGVNSNLNISDKISLRTAIMLSKYNSGYNEFSLDGYTKILSKYTSYNFEFPVPFEIKYIIKKHKYNSIYSGIGEFLSYIYKYKEITIINGNKNTTIINKIHYDYLYTKLFIGGELFINKRFILNIEPSFLTDLGYSNKY